MTWLLEHRVQRAVDGPHADQWDASLLEVSQELEREGGILFGILSADGEATKHVSPIAAELPGKA
jgi:hypothetical protein